MKNLTLLLLLLTLTCPAEASDFQSWVRHFRNEAVSRGVDAQIYDQAFRNVQPVHRAIELDRKQPERTKMGFSKYLSNVMNQARIDNGRAGLENNRGLLNSVQSRYGVPAEIIVALWGVETSYGKNTGGFDLISVLATLAWDGRRADFFKNELVKILPDWNNAEQSGIFAENFFPDNPIDTLKKYAIELYGKAGKIISVSPVKPENQLRGSFMLTGEKADIEIYFTLSPENPPLIQEYHIREIPKKKSL